LKIAHFIVSYNEMKGKQFEVKGQAGKNRALTLVTAAMKKRSGR
jgi:inorganic pyrophosphatase